MSAARRTAHRFAWALGLSALLHLILTVGPTIPVPVYRPTPVLEASLAPLPPPSPPSAKPRPPPHRHPSSSARRPSRPAPVAPPHPSAPMAPPAPPAPVEVEETPPPPKPSPAEAEQLPEIPLPERADIRYEIYKGRDGFPVGRATHTWKRSGTHYTITHVAEASGIVSLFYSGRHVQISSGEITPQGLRPDSYWVERGQSADKTDAARFDWDAMRLTLVSAGNSRMVELAPGTQDLLSLSYQLAFSPHLEGGTRIHVTNGRKLESYGYRAAGEDVLETPAGQIKALHIEKVHRQGEENTEIWLATEYHYIPVKIRQTDKQGDVFEETAVAIDIP